MATMATMATMAFFGYCGYYDYYGLGLQSGRVVHGSPVRIMSRMQGAFNSVVVSHTVASAVQRVHLKKTHLRIQN